MDINKRVEQKHQELLEVFSGLSENQLKVAGDLIYQASFLSCMLEDLASEISETGSMETYDNGGGQKGTKLSSAVKAYNSAISKYTTITCKLLNLTPAAVDRAAMRAEIQAKELEYKEKAEVAAKEAKKEAIRRIADREAMEALSRGEITQDELLSYERKLIEKYSY